ncbi:MAG: DUF4270 family protein [Bacteroidota bacterium]
MKSNLLTLIASLSIAIVFSLTSSCSDPTLVGADLLEEEQVSVKVIDTISLQTYTEQYDSVLTYSPFESSQLSDYLVGKMSDPVFGSTESVLYAQLLLGNESLDLTDATFDSLVLVLPIDSAAVYGNQPQQYDFEVRRILEEIDSDANVYSNQIFDVADAPIGRFSGTVNPLVTRGVFNPIADSIQQVRQLRICMNDDFAQELFGQDTSVFRSDAAFRSYLKGIQLVGTSENTGLLGFNLPASAGLQLYYTKDTVSTVFNFNFQVDGVRALHIRHDYEGTVAASFVENQRLGDSLFLLQGLGGLRGIIELPYITQLENVVVNRAEIRIPIQPTETDDYAVPTGLRLRYLDERSGELEDVDDFLFASASGSVSGLFGGVVVQGDSGDSDYYAFNISDHLQEMISGNVPNRLIVEVAVHEQRAGRVQLKGSKNSEPIQMSIVITEL